MQPLFVLVHSPALGPASWAPVARELSARGYPVAVPSLLSIGTGGPPFWPRAVEAVTRALSTVDAPVVLAGHSGAGPLLPAIADALPHVDVCLWVDAGIPGPGPVPATEPAFLDFLRGLTGPDGLLPRWTEWWGDEDLGPLFPDPATRTAVTAEQPRLPLSYYEEPVPVPDGWPATPCGYLLFSEGYAGDAATARERGWPVRYLPGGHLHQLVDPCGVTEALLLLSRSG